MSMSHAAVIPANIAAIAGAACIVVAVAFGATEPVADNGGMAPLASSADGHPWDEPDDGHPWDGLADGHP